MNYIKLKLLRIVSKRLTSSSSSPAVPPQFVRLVVRSDRAPGPSAPCPGTTIVSTPAIRERERTAVAFRSTIFAGSLVQKYKRNNQ